jgi:glutathione synthase/RimK-type ligase-like ATP-grasp enzyme
MKPILIITSNPDPHADQVESLLESVGVNTIRLVTNKFSSDSYLGYSSPKNQTYIKHKSHTYFPDDFHSVWYRKPELWLANRLPLKSTAGLIYKFRKGEINQMLKQFMLESENIGIFTVSKTSNIEKARNKLSQLTQASELGFVTPKTLVSSSPNEISLFLKNLGSCIIKTLGTSYVEYGRKQMNFFTYPINSEMFLKFRNGMLFDQPIYIQENIFKKFELRITLVGNKSFTCAIDSQILDESATDWRTVQPEILPHSVFKLPIKVENLCQQLRVKMGLEYCAIDMAVTPENKYVFFEINPNGQYLWIEEQTKLPISQAISNLLRYHN